MTKNNRIVRIAVSAFLALAAAAVLISSILTQTTKDYPGIGPFTIPYFVLGFIIILCLEETVKESFLFRKELKEAKNAGQKMERGEAILPLRAFVVMVALFVYYLLWEYIGFLICTIIFVAAIAWFFRPKKRWWIYLLVGLCWAIFMYFVFLVLFHVQIPDPIMDLINF